MKIKTIDDERKSLKIGNYTIKDLRNPDGTFQKGTEIGRMPKNGFTLSDLNRLIAEFEKSPENKKGSLLKHYMRRLFKNDKLLAKYMDKNIATKNQLTGADGGPLNITLNELIYGKEPGEAKKKDPETPAK